MSAKFYTLLTDIGAAKLASAAALGMPLKITQMAVGDGGGVLPTPSAQQTALVAEKRRAALNMLYIDPQNSSQIIAEQVIPETEGGWWIREVGLFDDTGALIAVGNCPESYKPQLAEGSGRTQTVRMVLITSSTDNITLKIDPAVVLATRKYVDDKVLELKVYVDELMAKHIAAADPHTQYAPKESPTLTGTPKAPTAPAGTNTTQIASTAFVQAVVTALNNALALKAPLASPALTGTPTAPTAAQTVNNTQVATTAFVKSAIAALVASSPAALDTLNELAEALGNDPNFATTMTNALAGKQPLDATLTSLSGKSISGLLQYLGLKETLNPSKRVSIGSLGTGLFDGSKPAINIGDSDSGFIFESDGVIGIYANNQKIAELTNTGIKSIGQMTILSGALILENDTYFLQHSSADNAGFSGNNIELGSWNGIGFPCTYDQITRIYLNTRTGEIGLTGDLKAGGNVYSGSNAWLDQTGNLQGSAWGSGGLKQYMSNGFNKKNTTSLAVNGWHKDESTGIITQWGSGNTTTIGANVTFPIPFPNVCTSITSNERNNNITPVIINFSGVGKTGFTVQAWNNNAARVDSSISWVATGY
ncbi:phage tail protein [Enterobacter roggenkampii]|uniref:phage tail-collar fiber domain-containing protein n=1 Tax=Enterobacter roggenkampii TaxID=1812935 RepID=UPI000ABF0706|nr:phage tail protein [Enterobacter roggenkampii]MDV5318665.1 phage tail protein [Enterobacter roggenkampii]MDV5328612.1 phage tail protein [Enterobacter roggenkampii]MDV5679603.1 phage tail protein [Enterobacter roggenkampii]